MKIKKRYLIGFAAVSLTAALALCGCGKEKKDSSEERELTWWSEFGNQSVAGVSNYDDLPVFQKLQEKFNVDIKFTHPVAGQVKEQLNLLLASQDLPDIIQYQFYECPGGAQKAIDDNVIMSLNDLIRDKAPNLSKYLSEHKEVDKLVKTDEKQYYCFPHIYGDEFLLTYSGPIVRQDYLEKIGMKSPETIDEWHDMLAAFKTQLEIESPYSAQLLGLTNTFPQAFGVSNTVFVDNKKVKFGPLEDGYKEFIETMRKWYAEGLIDKNLASLDKKTVSQNVLNSYTGATYGNTSGGIGTWMAAAQDGFRVAAAKYPVLKKGDKPMMGHRINPYYPFGSASLSTQCKNPELAAEILDYGYSEEGILLYNFGIEGENYTMEDGYPKYTEAMTNDSEGRSLSTMVGIYTSPNGNAATIVDKRYMEQVAKMPEQIESIKLWADADTKDHYMPTVYFTSAEGSELASLQTELESIRDQYLLKFITGVEDMSKYDTFIGALKQTGAERYVELYQAAYDRYLAK